MGRNVLDITAAYAAKDKNILLTSGYDRQMFDRLYEVVYNNKFTYITVLQSLKYTEIRQWVISKTPLLDNIDFEYSDATRLVWVFAGLDTFPICANPTCRNIIGLRKNVTFKNYYSSYCCNRCLGKDPRTVLKKQNTMFQNFGWHKKEKKLLWRELHPEDAYNRAQATKTYKEKTGYDWPMQNPEVQNKTKAVLFERYGYNNVGLVPEFREKSTKTRNSHVDIIAESYRKRQLKIMQTCLEKYGYKNVFSIPSIRQKIISTNRIKYGVDYPQQNEEFKHHVKATRIKKYGVSYIPSCRYVYNGIRFDSTAELAFWIYKKEIGSDIRKCNESDRMEFESCGQIVGYYPDFFLDGKYIELKGDQFFRKDGTMFCPYRKKTWTNEQYQIVCQRYTDKQKCMVDHGVVILKYKSDEVQDALKYVSLKYGKNYFKLFRKQKN